MTGLPLATLLVAALGLGLATAPAPRGGAPAPDVACRLDVFTPKQRARHAQLLDELRAAVREVREGRDGWSFALGDAPEPFTKAAEWITLERRCCPFLAFRLETSAADGTWLTVSGPPAAKALIRAAFADE
jgi:hypothetical protein